MRDVDGGRGIYEIGIFCFFVFFFCFLPRDWWGLGGSLELLRDSSDLVKSGNFTLYVPTYADDYRSGVEAVELS